MTSIPLPSTANVTPPVASAPRWAAASMPSAPPETTPYPAPTAAPARPSARRQAEPDAARAPTRASIRSFAVGKRPEHHRVLGTLESWRNAAGKVGASGVTLKKEGPLAKLV